MEKFGTIFLEGIGPVAIYRSKRARRLVISVSCSKGVRIAVPTCGSKKEALEFLQHKEQWVQRQLARIEQDKIRKKAFEDVYLQIDKVEAQRRLEDKVKQLAKKHGFTCNKISIRNQRTRWGSCSPQNNISLNMKLVLLPEELIDYVILHELVHTRIHNHGKKFWAELDRYVGDARTKAKIFRQTVKMPLG